MTRRAKIVCTIGPESRSPEKLRALIEAGMDVARLNFSHGTHAQHGEVIASLRAISAEIGRPLALLQDLQGPKIRIGDVVGGSLQLITGEALAISTAGVCDERTVPTSYVSLTRDVGVGDLILLSDGLIGLEVVAVEEQTVRCLVRESGTLRSRAGMNIPTATLSAESLTPKDRQDLEFGLDQSVDYVALSFVRRASDIEELTQLIRARGGTAGTVAKLEKPQAIDELDGIMDAADAVMVARGDLGVELSPERVPFVQKEIIRRAATHMVPVITATQMLESMTEHPQPTRAEASDVANAILDGTDAVMLSGETAVGKYPVEAVRMMHRIVVEAESHPFEPSSPERRRRARDAPAPFPRAIAQAACRVAAEVKAAAIVAFTESGFTARLISKYRPATPIIAVSADEAVRRRVSLYWGVISCLVDRAEDPEKRIERVDRTLREDGVVESGDSLVVIAGIPAGGTTNLLKLHRSGESTAA